MKATAPLHRFRLYPEAPHGLYVAVNVWETQRDLRHHLRHVRNLSRVGDTVANCLGLDVTAFPKNSPPRKRPLFAEVNFSRRRVGTRILVHELLHAAIAWGRRLKLDGQQMFMEEVGGVADDVEERVCLAHGELCSAFVNRMYKLGLHQ